MMKINRLMLVPIMALGLALPVFNTTEAANIALLPLINNVVDREDLGQIYYDRAVSAIKLAEDFEIVDNADLDKVIAKHTKQNVLPDKAACEAIASESNVDCVVVMQADSLELKEVQMDTQGDKVTLNFRGRLVSYNALTGKFINKTINEEDKQPGMMMARYDLSGDQFANSVTREIKRVLGVKKVTFEKPKISKAGLKGNAQ